MKWFKTFKDRLKKELVGSNIPTYLDHDNPVVLTFPDGHQENGVVKILHMYHTGWAYVIKSETGEEHVLTYFPDKKVKNPIEVKVYNPIEDSYYDIKEIEFDLQEDKEDLKEL